MIVIQIQIQIQVMLILLCRITFLSELTELLSQLEEK